jgi:hypothetical protein
VKSNRFTMKPVVHFGSLALFDVSSAALPLLKHFYVMD